MPKKTSNAKYIVIFVLIQAAWLAVLGLWIARYVNTHMVLKDIDQRYAIHINTGGNVAILVVGLALIAITTAGMWILFRYLNFHFHQTKLYDNFIASITHELKTPLASVQLYLETLDSYTDISEPQLRGFTTKMSREVTRLNRMINSILEVGRFESGQATRNCQLVNAGKALNQIWEDLRTQYALENDRFRISGSSDSQAVLDVDTVRLLFENLIDNSIKYSRGEPQIEIKLADSEKYITILYRDYGHGVQPSQLRKIFKKFYRLREVPHPNVRGTGLGLFLVKNIVNFHGGRIKAQIPGKKPGLQFHIELPRYRVCRKHYLNKLLNPKD
ncbi:MAG TPA: HAMP domain-containing histidine kinase [Candidatus Marinimicrobia bacterium]|nr:HAMP domain-containing histidine kinase [Candidatus Neomarinimicrobiota bacterium]